MCAPRAACAPVDAPSRGRGRHPLTRAAALLGRGSTPRRCCRSPCRSPCRECPPPHACSSGSRRALLPPQASGMRLLVKLRAPHRKAANVRDVVDASSSFGQFGKKELACRVTTVSEGVLRIRYLCRLGRRRSHGSLAGGKCGAVDRSYVRIAATDEKNSSTFMQPAMN